MDEKVTKNKARALRSDVFRVFLWHVCNNTHHSSNSCGQCKSCPPVQQVSQLALFGNFLEKIGQISDGIYIIDNYQQDYLHVTKKFAISAFSAIAPYIGPSLVSGTIIHEIRL